jgi:hypothetical protein
MGPGADMPQAVRRAAAALQVDLVTREVTARLERAGVSCVLLKGPTFARWLYDDVLSRPYSDTDLLVRIQDLPHAREALTGSGFDAHGAGGTGPSLHHAEPWIRPLDGAIVDLHHRLPGMSGSADAWQVLSGHTEQMTLRGAEVTILDEPARALHVALHAAQHGSERDASLQDLERALAVVSPEVWALAADIARATGAKAALATGLRMRPGGERIVEELGLGAIAADAQELAEIVRQSEGRAPVVQGLVWLGSVRGTRTRAALILHKAFPPRDALRQWAATTPAGVLRVLPPRLRRPVWLVVRAPRALLRYRRARRRQHALAGKTNADS